MLFLLHLPRGPSGPLAFLCCLFFWLIYEYLLFIKTTQKEFNMKRHFEQPVETITLSVEEEAVLVDEQNEIVANIAQQNDLGDRLVDTVEGVASAETALTGVGEVTDVEKELVATVGEMAVAGTDGDPDDIISVSSNGLSAEGFADKAIEGLKKLWEKIKKMMVDIWNRIVEFFKGQNKQLENAVNAQKSIDEFIEENKPILMLQYDPTKAKQEEAATAAKATAAKETEARKAKIAQNLKELESKLPHLEFKFGGNLNLISTLSGVPKDFTKELTNVLSFSQNTFKDLARQLREISYNFDQSLEKMSGEHGEQAISQFCEKFAKDFEVVMRSAGEVKGEDGVLFGRTKDTMLGHFIIEAEGFSYKADAKPPVKLSNAARSTLKVTSGGEAKSGNAPVGTASLDEGFGNAIRRWLDFSTSNEVKTAKEQLQQYATKFITHIDRLVNIQASVKGHADGDESYRLLQGIIEMSRSLNKLLISFTTQHINAGLHIVRAAQQYQKAANDERVRLYNEAVNVQ